MQKFKDGKLQILVATDVAARGLDIDDLPLVVNYELPHVPEDYIHRIGRTGRAGATGEAISLVAHEEEKYLTEIERLLRKKIDVQSSDAPAARRSEREPRGERRSERPAREPKAQAPRPHAARAVQRVNGHDAAQARSRRDVERDEAYAKNPDQPIARPHARIHAAGGAHGHARHHTGARHARPVAALLKKRPLSEPEKV